MALRDAKYRQPIDL